jgi:hypothetical protein
MLLRRYQHIKIYNHGQYSVGDFPINRTKRRRLKCFENPVKSDSYFSRFLMGEKKLIAVLILGTVEVGFFCPGSTTSVQHTKLVRREANALCMN